MKNVLSIVILVFGLFPLISYAQSDGLPRGAYDLPYTRYESENASLGGAASLKSDPTFVQSQIASEATNQKYVALPSNGSSVSWTITNSGAGFNMRFTMPDAAGGVTGLTGSLNLYVNNVLVKNINLTSYWSYQYFRLYEHDPTNTPAPLTFMMFDEVHFKLTNKLNVGDVVRIQKDNGDGLEYGVDFIEVEEVPAALGKPAGYVSVTDFGAIADDGIDDQTAFNNAITAADASNTGVYIPEGQFTLANCWRVSASNIGIKGAGMWYTNVYYSTNAFFSGGLMSNSTDLDISDFYISTKNNIRWENGVYRVYKCFMGTYGTNTKIQRIWEEHFECGMWIGDYDNTPLGHTSNLLVSHCRIRNNYADGINFCQGTNNSIIEFCSVRNNGDDGLASWAAKDMGNTVECTNLEFRNNTIENNWRAGSIGIFGGSNHKIHHNYIKDGKAGSGIRFTTEFSGFLFENNTDMRVYENTIINCGTSTDLVDQEKGALELYSSAGSIKNITYTNNNIINAQRHGVIIGTGTIDNIKFDNLTINGTGLDSETKSAFAAPSGGYAVFCFAGSGTSTFTNLVTSNIEEPGLYYKGNQAYNLIINTAPNVPVTGVMVSPTSKSVQQALTTQLTATIAPADATNKNVTWTSSNQAVATVNASGLVTAVTPGTATITVTTADGAKTATCSITVTPGAPVVSSSGTASGTINSAFSYAITASNTPTSYAATGLPAGVSVNASTGVISGTPSASGTFNATVSATNSVGTGSKALVITINSLPGVSSYSSGALVEGNPTQASFIITGTALTASINVAYTISGTASSADYTASPALSGTVTLTPSVPSVSINLSVVDDNIQESLESITLTLSANAGYTVLTVPSNLGITDNDQPPVMNSLDAVSATVGVPFSYNITGTNSPTSYNATNLPAGLSVNTSTGVISGTPTTSGTFTPTISATNTWGTGSKTLTITIAAAPPCDAPFIKSTSTAPTIDTSIDGIWSNATVGTIGNATLGSIPSDFAGSQWRALYDNNNLYILVEVKDANRFNDSGTSWWEDDAVEIFIDGNNSKGTSYDGANDFQYGFRYNDATIKVGGSSVNRTTGVVFAQHNVTNGYNIEISIPWTTIGVAPTAGNKIGFDISVDDDDNAGTRDSQVTAFATTGVGYTNPSVFGSVTLCNSTQQPVAVTGVTVSPASASINAGSTQQLTATVAPANATNKTVSWSSSNTAVATVSSSGLVTGVAAGTAVITVTTQDGNKTATSSFTITTASVPVTAVSVSPTTASLVVGATQQLTATVAPANATNKNVTWSSGNTSVATVSTSGLVTAIAAGTATITVTTQDGGKTAMSSFTITAANISVTGVTVSPTSASLTVGATQQLAATLSPANATNKNVAWSSSNTSVASVNTNGLVSAVSAGSAVITVTTQDGAKTATATITVTNPSGTITCFKTTGTITVNGQLTETSWAINTSFAKNTLGTSNNTATFGVLWDSNNLYIGAKVLDANLNSDSSDPWEDDAVEVYIDANNNKLSSYDGLDNQIIKNYNKSTVFTKLGITGLQHAWAAISGGYSIELAIPWSQLGISAPAQGTTIGFDIGYDDDDNAGGRDGQAVWNGTINNYASTSGFGSLVLNASNSPAGRMATEADKVGNVKYFPTIVDNDLTVETDGSYHTVAVIDMFGKVQYLDEGIGGRKSLQLNLSNLAAGMHLIKMYGSHQPSVFKIIKK